MNKSAAAILAATLVLSACATDTVPPPPPVVTVVKAEPQFPPRPLNLLYTTFQDHAVIQRDQPIPVWGLTAPGATVDVSLGGQSAQTTADATGHWSASLPAMAAGGPYALSATSSSGQSQTVSDVMLGDVYLCSGQSNMELPLRLATNYDGELRSATNRMLRLFHVQRFTSPVPRATFGADASWAVTSPETAREFSATCYYFGREVQPAAGVAVGLIEDAWGGSAIQAWISNERLAALGGYNETLDIVHAYAASPAEGDLRYRALVRRWFDTNDPAMRAATPWYAPGFDDSGWNSHVPSGTWRVWNIPLLQTFNGVTWLRKTVELSAAEAQGAATLSLGAIDSFDLAFVNGVEVGAGEGYDAPRHYSVPAGTLHEGRNVIAVAINAGAGLLDPADKLMLKLAGGTARTLDGAWRWQTSVAANGLPPLPHQPWLNQFGVSLLYNGMILPLGQTRIRGVVWYQGETDSGQPAEYRRLLRALIDDWRGRFGAETPFFIVQLPGFGAPRTAPGTSGWIETRESQRYVVSTTPNTGLAVTTDLGVADNIHPQSKQEVGRRLGLLARQMIYRQAVEGASPSPMAVMRHGRLLTVTFTHVGGGLVAREWDRAIGFTVCTAANDCRYSEGTVANDSVTLPITLPRAAKVRFCWSDTPMCNLYSREGLPAVPFELPIAAPLLRH
jgi:sialate O-acetylesterase